MKKVYVAALSVLMLPLSTLAQELPNSGAQDEGLGKEKVSKLVSVIPSHSAPRRIRFEDGISVAAMRWKPGEATVWVYRGNASSMKNDPYHHFAIRVYMNQVAPGQVELKTMAFCDVGPDKFMEISAERCNTIKTDVMPKLVAGHRQDFMTFVGGDNTTPAQIKAAATALHDALAPMIGVAPKIGDAKLKLGDGQL